MRSIWPSGRLERRGAHPPAGAFDGLFEPGRLHRLQQVVHRVHLERLDGVAVERGDEHDVRRAAVLDQPVRHFEAVEPGHLDVEKHHFGREALDDADRFQAVARLRDHLHAAHLLEHVAQLFARQLLVVHDDGLNGP